MSLARDIMSTLDTRKENHLDVSRNYVTIMFKQWSQFKKYTGVYNAKSESVRKFIIKNT